MSVSPPFASPSLGRQEGTETQTQGGQRWGRSGHLAPHCLSSGQRSSVLIPSWPSRFSPHPCTPIPLHISPQAPILPPAPTSSPGEPGKQRSPHQDPRASHAGRRLDKAPGFIHEPWLLMDRAWLSLAGFQPPPKLKPQGFVKLIQGCLEKVTRNRKLIVGS